MRNDSITYTNLNADYRRDIRHVVTLDINGDGSAIYYLTSHLDIVTPDSTKTFYGVVANIPVESQHLNPLEARSEIGYGKIFLKDISDEFTDFLAAQFSGANTIRYRKVEFYTGFAGMEFADYALIGTQIVEGDTTVDIVDYSISTMDLQRAMRETVFTPQTTTLTKNITPTQTYIHVADPSYFETLEHDTKFSDRPSGGPNNHIVGYIKINDGDKPEKILWEDKEVNTIQVTGTDISFSSADNSINSVTTDISGDGTNSYVAGMGLEVQNSTGNSSLFTIVSVATHKIVVTETITTESAGPNIVLLVEPQFYNCERAALSSKALEHTTDLTTSVDRRTKVTEHIYLETNILKLLYGVLTGIWYGTAITWPTEWTLGIDTSLIETSEFIYNYDLWNTADDNGLPMRFEGESMQDAKQFIEQQLNFPAGGVIRVLNNGKLGFKRFTRVLSTASPVGYFNKSNLVSRSAITYAMADVTNLMYVNWNYEDRYGRTTRRDPLIDVTSISKYRLGKTMEFELRGLNGSLHTVPLLYSIFDMVRDRFSGYPIQMTCVGLPELNVYEIGDVIWFDEPDMRDHTNATTKRLSRAFEIQQKSYDPSIGLPSFTLFGSAEPASALSNYLDSTVLPDSYYNSEGTDITTVTTGSWSAGVGSTWTITANHTFTGNADLTNAAAIYYCLGNLTVQSGIKITCTQNMQFRVKGLITLNGGFDTKGQGLAGGSGYTVNPSEYAGLVTRYGTIGASGYLGITESVGFLYDGYSTAQSFKTNPTVGQYSTAPYLYLKNTGTLLEGIPTDLRGTSGGAGNPLRIIGGVYPSNGGNGATGPGGLLFVCRGMTFGASGYIDVSGSEGAAGTLFSPTAAQRTAGLVSAYSGAGAPSHPAAVYVLLDGNDSLYPENKIIAEFPSTITKGFPAEKPLAYFSSPPQEPIESFYRGSQGIADASENVFRVQYIPKSETPVVDIPPVATKATALTITEATAKNTINTVILQIGATAPSDGNYRGSFIRISKQNTDVWMDLGEVRGSYTIPVYVPTDASTYVIRAFPVSQKGEISNEYYSDTHTVPDTIHVTFDDGTVGSGVIQNNTDALNSDCIFIHSNLNNEVAESSGSGTWTITDYSYGRKIDNSTAETSVNHDEQISRSLDLTDYSWDKSRTIEYKISYSASPGGKFYAATGTYNFTSPTHRHFGFYYDFISSADHWVATWGDGTTEYTYDLGAASSLDILKAVLTAGSSPTIEFYVNGVLKYTATSNIPTGVTDANIAFAYGATKTGASALTFYIGEILIHQAP